MTTPDCRVHFASINTAAVTELCIRTMREFAGYPFELVVGDCGSTDGSLEMLQRFEQRGLAAPRGRARRPASPRLARRLVGNVPDALRGLLRLRHRVPPAELPAKDGRASPRRRGRAGRDPHPGPRRRVVPAPGLGARRILAERPEPWLMLIDVEQTRGVVTDSSAYRDELQPDGRTKVAYDTAAAFFRDLQSSGLRYAEMPPEFARSYRHYGSLSWQSVGDRAMPSRFGRSRS